MTASTSGLIPAPRPAAEQPDVPLRLPWRRAWVACRPLIGDALLLQYSLRRSTRCMPELTVRQAREMITTWAAAQRAAAARRDEVVRAAVAAGLSKSEVHRLTGIARTTVNRIVGSGRDAAAEASPE